MFTLEALGLVLDPLRRELKLLPVVLTWVGTDPKSKRPGNPQSKIVLIAWFSLRGVCCLPLLLHRLVYVSVVERLLDVGLLGFGMIDESQRIRHRFLNDPEGGGESVFVIFEAAL